VALKALDAALAMAHSTCMNTVKDIQKAVSNLPKADLRRFREWFEEFDARLWDEQIEQDIRSGKLDELADEAIERFRSGKRTKL